MEKINIETIKRLCSEGKLHWTNHVVLRLLKRNLGQSDVELVLLQGEIIEQYVDDYPHPSCLIMGETGESSYLHVVCGVCDEKLWIITAYKPDDNKWEPDYKTRKKE